MNPTSHQLAITLHGEPRKKVFVYPGAADEVASIGRRLVGRIIPTEATTLAVVIIDERPGDEAPRVGPLVTYGKEPGALLLASVFEHLGHALCEALETVCTEDLDSVVCAMASSLGMQRASCDPAVFYDPHLLAVFADFALNPPAPAGSVPSIAIIEVGDALLRRVPRGELERPEWSVISWQRATEAERAA